MAKNSERTVVQNRGSQDELVPLRFKLRNRFYEVLVLLHALREMHIETGKTAQPSLEPGLDASQPVHQQFRSFVNKLGHLCDDSKGGDTVTAFAVLETPSGTLYAFASNSRSGPCLEKTRQYITDLLTSVEIYSNKLRHNEAISNILRKVLVFVRARARVYANTIYTEAEKCIEACKDEAADETERTCEELKRLKESAALASDKSTEDRNFSEICEDLIIRIDAVYNSPLQGFASRHRHENSCWGELRHATGRLLSYLHGVRIIFSSRSRWPQLFESFKVVAVPSRARIPNPLGGNVRKDHSASGIIGRMTSDPSRIEKHREEADGLQRFNLDSRIQEEAERQGFKPLIHAELNLHDWLLRSGYNHPSNFFQGIKYIGCSKPTCKLCQLYFDKHPSGFSVRPGHGNLYIRWRAPDVSVSQGDQVVRDRENIMNKILEPIREETLRTISEKAGLVTLKSSALATIGSLYYQVSEYKRHDSNTDPTRNMYQTAYDGSVRDEDDALSTTGGVDTGIDTEESSPASRTDSPAERELTEMFQGVGVRDEEEIDSGDEAEGGVEI